jgi:hypothetical protein
MLYGVGGNLLCIIRTHAHTHTHSIDTYNRVGQYFPQWRCESRLISAVIVQLLVM